MRLDPTPLPDLLVVTLEPIADERGWFARSFCEAAFRARGIDFRIVQANVSVNAAAGTLRGLHYQADPHGEPKLVRCSRGRIWDVAVDLRPGSPTRCRWFGLELGPERPEMLYIPAGFAHGFVTLEPDSEVTYQMGAPYVPEAARGVRWDDPAFAIAWPRLPAAISARDGLYPNYTGHD
jgi:dTDP-4-dehydrorhamnose 3,5-epimerase